MLLGAELCSWMTSPIGRRSIVHQCAECCDPTSSPNCNGRLCNFSGFCRVCYGVHQDASSCPLTQCADDEMCFTGNRHVGGGAFRRVYGCESSRMCLALAKAVAGLPGQPVGRRNVHGDTGLHTCDACCLTYDCNSRPCEQVVKDMPFMRPAVLDKSSLNAIQNGCRPSVPMSKEMSSRDAQIFDSIKK
uniref:Uncharacterized protein n=1 Tax=Magallana gigas TaxID=29159 RepID=K1R246_MAGGI